MLRSGATGFRTPGGALLDGNADGIPGDDYLTSIAAPPQTVDTVLSVPDFTRGPGQSIILPLQLSNGRWRDDGHP